MSVKTSPTDDYAKLSLYIVDNNWITSERSPIEAYLPVWMQKSPLMVPGLESAGLVSPSITRPVLTTLSPSQTMGTTGPICMYWINEGKNGRLERSA